MLVAAAAATAKNLPETQVAKIIEYRGSLDLTDSQVRKLEIIEKVATEKMVYAKMQADIRLKEIEKFTSNWTNMNGLAVRGLIKEYYGFLTEYKSAELNAILQARGVLEYEQLSRFQQLVSIESMVFDMERELALR